MGRTYAAVALRASKLGLADQRRESVGKINGRYPSRAPKYETTEERNRATGERMREWFKLHGHPRGALGMMHSEETKRRIGEMSRAMMSRRTPLQREIIRLKSNATKLARYGTAGPSLRGEAMYSRARGGKRADLGNVYYRSAWEANYARYLNFLVSKGSIKGWEFEPKTFVFEGVTRGVLSYTPDFLVTENDGSTIWHEVKGWMDAKSKAKLKRMAKFYPDEVILVVGPEEYRAIAKWAPLIGGWE